VQLSSTLGHQEIVAAFALADRVPGEFSAWVRMAVILPDDVPETLRDLDEFDVNLLVDRNGEFAGSYGDQSALWLMRPDGHLGYRAHLSDGDQLLLYLRNLFARRD
jgi:pentachlorophenol monooxygenase